MQPTEKITSWLAYEAKRLMYPTTTKRCYDTRENELKIKTAVRGVKARQGKAKQSKAKQCEARQWETARRRNLPSSSSDDVFTN